MHVICISGKAGHGKDTFAECVYSLIESEGKKVLITHYADLLKYVATTFFLWDGNKDEAGRSLLQHLGTEVFRGMSENYWVDFISTCLNASKSLWDFVLIPDCRFPNEVDLLRERGFDVIHVHVSRPDFEGNLTSDQSAHSSETSMDSVIPDVYIINDATVASLRNKASVFLNVNYDIDCPIYVDASNENQNNSNIRTINVHDAGMITVNEPVNMLTGTGYTDIAELHHDVQSLHDRIYDIESTRARLTDLEQCLNDIRQGIPSIVRDIMIEQEIIRDHEDYTWED